jgi:hypothetical protein
VVLVQMFAVVALGVGERERPQPARTFSEPFPSRGGRRATVPHLFLACMMTGSTGLCLLIGMTAPIAA